MVPASIAAQPVPPFATCRMPETSDARFTKPVETTPAAARRTPVNVAMERFPKNAEVEDAYVAVRLVVEAFPNVVFPVTSSVEESVAAPVSARVPWRTELPVVVAPPLMVKPPV